MLIRPKETERKRASHRPERRQPKISKIHVVRMEVMASPKLSMPVTAEAQET